MAWCKAQFSNIILCLSFIMCKRYIRSQAHPNCLFLPEWYFYFYEILTTFNKLKIMSEVVLLSFLFWLLCCLSFNLRIMITPFVLSLLTIVLSLLQSTDYDYPFCPFSFDYCVVSPSIYGLWLPLLSFLFWLLCCLSFTEYDYPCGIFKLFLHMTFEHIFYLVICSHRG